MLLFSANLNFLFNEVPFMEKFAEAAKAGFKYVEFMFPDGYDIQEIKDQLDENKLKLVLINLPAGNWGEGDRGLAVDPARKEEFLASVPKAIEVALKLGVPRANCLVGKVQGNYSEEEIISNLNDNIRFAAKEFEKVGLDLMIESINSFDIPGFYLNTTKQVMDIINALELPNVFLQYDIYHAEREGEKHEKLIEEYISKIGHVQIADNPGRNEPGTGIIPIKELIEKLDNVGYRGYFGLEYKPSGKTVHSLGWIKEFGKSL